MPATEETWYNQKLLHVIFGCSSLVMLISVVWMIAQDHEREWKGVQRDFRDIQQKQLAGRLRAEQKNQIEVVKQAELQLAAKQSETLDPSMIDRFKEISKGVDDYSFSRMDDNLAELKVESGNAKTAADQFEAIQVKLREARAAVQSADDATRDAATTAMQRAEAEVAPIASKLGDAQSAAQNLRSRVMDRLNGVVKVAKFQMDEAARNKKLVSAQFDAIKARQGLLYGKEQFAAAAKLQDDVDKQKAVLSEALGLQEDTTSRRNKLRDLITDITGAETSAKKDLDDALAEQNRLEGAIEEIDIQYVSWKTVLGKKLLEVPVVDGFNGPLKIDNLWTDGLKMPNGSFGEVRRFDRCTTCHKGIDKTAPGSSTIPGYEKRHEVVVQLQTPEVEPEPGATVEDVYGIILSDEGLVDRDDVTVEYVVSESLAATAINISDSSCATGIVESDVIRFVAGDGVDTPREAVEFLMNPSSGTSEPFEWGTPIEIVIERGFPEPFASHPRLGLYVGSMSPHKMSDIGCTVCHEGQGSGTSFNYASHTPDSLEQEDQWWKEYGWFSNHHWIYPMHPKRFAESSCLKCHHDVVELGPSEKFPETPAPKLLAGHNLIQAYGCYGCHEINGYKSATERIGPDLRLEPNYFAAAAQLAHDATFQALPEKDQELARQLVQHPEDDASRHQLVALLNADASADTPELSAKAHKLAEVLGDIEIPGTLRKAGPSLRHVKSKVGESFLYDWIREPKHFRASTKMPQFFGMWDHIQSDEDKKALDIAQRYEPVEILGIVTYLMDRSQPMMGSVAAPVGVAAPDADRGKIAFETRGCLACHQHSAFDDANHGTITAQARPGVSRQMQGPDLTNIGDKLSLADSPDAGKPVDQTWLYTWLRNPNLYHPRTKMPDLYLTKEVAPDGSATDPAADIATFLMTSTNGWKPDNPQLEAEGEVINEVAYEYLKKAFFGADAKKYMEQGIPEEIGKSLKGSEVELVNVDGSPGDMKKKLLTYIGAKTIGKYGCYGCHDIPGFEGSKPIGVALADWGRKDPSKIAFEHIAEYITHGHSGGHGGHGEGGHDGGHGDAHGDGEEHIDEHFYTHRLDHHDRTGFIWQKLKEPRSYDYKKVLNKDYNEKLRMPQFPFTDVQREQVITFILGLIAEPPAEKFVYRPDAKQHALVEGKKVLDKYNCAACHVLGTEKWEIEFRPGELGIGSGSEGFAFTNAHFGSAEVTASETPDKQRGTLTATLSGMPTIGGTLHGQETGHPALYEYDPGDIEEVEAFETDSTTDYDHTNLMRALTLWDPTVIEGEVLEPNQSVWAFPTAVKKRHKPIGGDLAFRLLPRVLELERGLGTAVPAAKTAWGWLPPPLHAEGKKVQSNWLHNFLLNPQMIRPAAVMRMPKFNMSSSEATAIVNYFAARDGAEFPYQYTPETDESTIQELEAQYAENGGDKSRFDSSMGIVTAGAGCVKCHVFGDYVPGGDDKPRAVALAGSTSRGGNTAPNLAEVYKRLRRDYVLPWVAMPSRILPYTPMNAVVPHNNPAMWEGSYKGSPEEQLNGVVDLIMNYDRYTAGNSSMKERVQAATPAKPAENAPAAAK